jgi:hypothetical protein
MVTLLVAVSVDVPLFILKFYQVRFKLTVTLYSCNVLCNLSALVTLVPD